MASDWTGADEQADPRSAGPFNYQLTGCSLYVLIGEPVHFGLGQAIGVGELWATVPTRDRGLGGRGMPSMRSKSVAALGLLLLFACHGAAIAESAVDPFLPPCKSLHETRIPVPTWDNNYGQLASLRRLISKWPSGTALVVYASFGAAEDHVQIEDEDKGYSVKFAFEGHERAAGEVSVSALERPQFNVGFYNYWGFFEVSPPPSPNGAIALRRLDTFNVVSSARYCLGNRTPSAPPREIPGAQVAQSGSLPVCRRLHESRIPIATWKPKLRQDHNSEFDVHVAPPLGNGRIVYISIEDPDWPCDAVSSIKGLYTVSYGWRAGVPGFDINLRGNDKPVGSGCRHEGFFMNEPVFGIHQGWTETYFGAIDRDRIVASSHYCVAR